MKKYIPLLYRELQRAINRLTLPYRKGPNNAFLKEPIDESIKLYIRRINKAGFETMGSCSGVPKDHLVYDPNTWPNLWIKLPDGVVKKVKKPFCYSRKYFLKKRIYDDFKQVAKSAGWKVVFITRKGGTPVVDFLFTDSIKKRFAKHVLRHWRLLTKELEKYGKNYKQSLS